VLNKLTKFLVLALGLLIVTACGMGEASGPKTVAVTEADSNKTIEVDKGDTLEVTLAGNPTTGFDWEAVPAPDSAILQPSGASTFTPDSDAVGSPGKSVMHFQAVGSGTTTLQLVYHRPSDPATAPTQTFTITVKVE